MTKKLRELAESKAKGLVCLVPRKEVGGITCHEKTLCDCSVLEIINALKTACDVIDVASEFILNSHHANDCASRCRLECDCGRAEFIDLIDDSAKKLGEG